ncbi:MAG: hypothetical protein O7G30_09510 [Proteobacteria bacterium]|nr:hypothetical protein [Pseudomonadota bacterium]
MAACAVLGARLLFCLFTARQEAAWWVWAAASFLPVSQLFPFVFPMADRYLYFIAPGLVGAALLLGSELWTRLGPAQARAAGRALTVAAALVVAVFAWQSHARSHLWTSESLLIVDGVRHYPEGALAHYGRARQAALRRDWDAAVASLRVATARGHRGLAHLLTDAAFSSQLGRPEMRSFVRELAGRQIEQIRSGGRLTVPSLLRLAQFHMIREEYDQATAVLEEIIVGGGPYERNARDLLAELTRGAAR